MALDPAREAALERARAVGILRTCFDVDPASLTIELLPFGVAVRGAEKAWIVSRSEDLAVLGGVLVWIDRHSATEVHLVVDHHPGVHARRVEILAGETQVWRSDGDRVVRAEIEPLGAVRPRPEGSASLEAVLVEAGLEVVCEDGIIRGELSGLEVARMVDGPEGLHLEVGVGRFDREAGALLHPERDAFAGLRDVIAIVGPHRRDGAPPHPINRLARERWLRASIIGDPSAVGLDDVVPVEPVPARRSLREPGPASLLGHDGDARVLAACSVGVDLGLVPEIADLYRRHEPDEVRVVVPSRDRFPALERVLARLPVPAAVRTVSAPWFEG